MIADSARNNDDIVRSLTPKRVKKLDFFELLRNRMRYDLSRDNRISSFVNAQDLRISRVPPASRIHQLDEKPFCHSRTRNVGEKLVLRVNGMPRNLYDGDEFTTG